MTQSQTPTPPNDGTILTSVKSPGANPQGLAHDGENLWVADRADRKIYKLNPVTGQVLFSIAFDGELAGTAWDGGHVWQADRTSRTISRIDPETGAIDRHLPIDITTGDVAGLYYQENALWYALSRLGQIRKVKDTDGRFMKAFPTRPDVGGLALVNNKHLCFTEPGAGLVHKMDAAAGTTLISYRVGGRPTTMCHDGTAYWIADQAAGEIRRIRFS